MVGESSSVKPSGCSLRLTTATPILIWPSSCFRHSSRSGLRVFRPTGFNGHFKRWPTSRGVSAPVPNARSFKQLPRRPRARDEQIDADCDVRASSHKRSFMQRDMASL